MAANALCALEETSSRSTSPIDMGRRTSLT